MAGSLYATATGMSGIKSLTLREGMSQPAVQVDVVCTGITAQIGDACNVDFGYDTDHAVALTGGIVKKINQRRPSQDYEVTVYDKLSKAVDYFLASDNPDSPFTIHNRKAELVVGDLLNQSGLTSFAYDTSFLTLGVDDAGQDSPIPVNLVSAWSYIEHINRMTGFITYADPSGTIQFRDRKPYVVGGDVSEHTFTTGSSGDILDIGYWKSDEKILNRIVIYGAPGIQATSSGSSPYLPANFYKSGVLAHESITNTSGAQQIASVNLTMLNRLTENCIIKAIGSKNYRCRDCVAVSEAFTGLTVASPWIVFSDTHILNREGYVVELNLTR